MQNPLGRLKLEDRYICADPSGMGTPPQPSGEFKGALSPTFTPSSGGQTGVLSLPKGNRDLSAVWGAFPTEAHPTGTRNLGHIC